MRGLRPRLRAAVAVGFAGLYLLALTGSTRFGLGLGLDQLTGAANFGRTGVSYSADVPAALIGVQAQPPAADSHPWRPMRYLPAAIPTAIALVEDPRSRQPGARPSAGSLIGGQPGGLIKLAAVKAAGSRAARFDVKHSPKDKAKPDR